MSISYNYSFFYSDATKNIDWYIDILKIFEKYGKVTNIEYIIQKNQREKRSIDSLSKDDLSKIVYQNNYGFNLEFEPNNLSIPRKYYHPVPFYLRQLIMPKIYRLNLLFNFRNQLQINYWNSRKEFEDAIKKGDATLDEEEDIYNRNEETMKWLIPISKELYQYMKPLRASFGWDGGFTEDGLLQYDIMRIHSIELFPPKLVEKISGEYILNAPVYKVVNLEDGGLLLILNKFPTFSCENDNTLEELQKYFRVQC